MKYLLLLLVIGCGSNVVQFKEEDNLSIPNSETECTEEQNKALASCLKQNLDPVYACDLQKITCLSECANYCYNNSLNVMNCVCLDYKTCYSTCEARCTSVSQC